MAVTHNQRSPVIMDTAGDELASIFQGRDMEDTTPVPRLWVETVEFVGVSSGSCVLLDSVGGGILFQSPELGAGENYNIRVRRWIQNAVCDPNWPAGSMVLLHYA